MQDTLSKVQEIGTNYCYTDIARVNHLRNCIDTSEAPPKQGCVEVTNLIKSINEYTVLLATYLHGNNFNGFKHSSHYLPALSYPNTFNPSTCGPDNCLILPYLKDTNIHSSLVPMMAHCLQGYQLYNRIMRYPMNVVLRIEKMTLKKWEIKMNKYIQDLTSNGETDKNSKKKKLEKIIDVLNRIILLRDFNENVCVNNWSPEQRQQHLRFTTEIMKLRHKSQVNYNYV